MKKLTTQDFIEKAEKVHGDKYGYLEVVYIGSKNPVKIKCNRCHQYFMQTPNDHLDGCGHKACSWKWNPTLIYGIGINDLQETISENGKHGALYTVWRSMLSRCYNEKDRGHNRTYKDCITCSEWHSLSSFRIFFDANYVEGYHLDKDILVKNSKIYSPSTCCFVPQEINALFTKRQNCRGEFPIGVYAKGRRYCAELSVGERYNRYIGMFDTPEEAFFAYKQAKETYIKEVANKWKDKITQNVYDTLMKYEVEITD